MVSPLLVNSKIFVSVRESDIKHSVDEELRWWRPRFIFFKVNHPTVIIVYKICLMLVAGVGQPHISTILNWQSS